MADTTLPGVMLTGDHASRPAASAVASGTLYACSTHKLVYQSDTSSWTTWFTGDASGSISPSTLIIPGASSPAQTAEGSAVWDTDDDKLTIGTGAGRKTLVNEGAITSSGLTQATARLLGRTTASSGAVEEITVGSGLSLSAGSLTATGGSGDVATDSIWDAKGDLAVGTGANTAAKLTVGANGAIPMAASGETTGLAWRRMIRGIVNSDGTEASDPDGAFSSTKDSTGNYTVTYGSAFSTAPLVLLTPWAFRLCRINTSSTTAFSVNSAAPNTGSDSDGKFSFLVIEI